jgi:DNA-binding response OmpR family regulator
MASVTLLVVEDEPLVLELLEAALSDGGFEVVVAVSGGEALALMEQDPGRFRAVLTDIRLGAGPDGWEVAQCARERMAAVPVVYMSGDSGHEWTSKGVPGSVLLAKPFAPAQLVTAVAALITEADMRAPPVEGN